MPSKPSSKLNYLRSRLEKGSLEFYIPWSPHRLKTWLTCRRQYFYEYVLHKKTKIPSSYARGIMLHRRMSNFFNKDGNPKYKSAETFANSVKGPWSFIRKRGMIQGREIEWKSEKESFYILAEMMKILKHVYEYYSKEQPPIAVEKPFNVIIISEYGEFYLTGRIDEVRYNPEKEIFVVRDHKTSRKTPNIQEVSYDYQFTFYSLGLASLIKDSSPSTDKRKKDILVYSLDQLLSIAENIELEYHDMRNGKILPLPRRNRDHFNDLFETLAVAELEIAKAFDSGIWATNRESCSNCLFFDICDRDSARVMYPKYEYRHQKTLFSLNVISEQNHFETKQQRIKFPRRSRKRSMKK